MKRRVIELEEKYLNLNQKINKDSINELTSDSKLEEILNQNLDSSLSTNEKFSGHYEESFKNSKVLLTSEHQSIVR